MGRGSWRRQRHTVRPVRRLPRFDRRPIDAARPAQLDRRSSTGVPITLFDRLQSHAVQTAWASRRPTLVTQVMALRQPSFLPAQRIASWRRTNFMHSQRSDREGKHPVKYN